MIFPSVPQLDLLPLCDAFLTHGGMGSVNEAMAFKVPLLVVPVFGDQVMNADSAHLRGFGVSFRYPLRTLTAESLKKAVSEVVDRKPTNTFRANAEAISARMEVAKGVDAAVDAILEAVKRNGVARVFRRFDENGQGFLDGKQLTKVLQMICKDVDDDFVTQMQVAIDVKKDGRMSFEECLDWIFAGGEYKDALSFSRPATTGNGVR
eukprot:gnl/TRDRNA2_/TRDRNA2_89470_c0_seq1.p1 gnl/TRDRNA2_/TRDRNA2_89470_c0~~gnl/TRDRNA2_/TRDRNA2_89470_c0_seq1.p1  ORF type:complete len:207 (+),score=37.03 gnl/TRDRNA2_/TRDRNA2_89470_c0_seq1:1-621(+)